MSVILSENRFPRFGIALAALADHVGQEAEEASALDRLGELALLLCRHRRDPARHDLAPLRHIALKELGVLVVDLRRIGAGERAGLAPAEERPPCATASTTAAATKSAAAVTIAITECHDRSSSVAALRSSSRSRRGGRSPRSPPNPPPPPKRSPRSPKRPPPRSSRSRSRSTLRIIADGPSSSSSTRTVR